MFPETVESTTLASNYGYDKWLMNRFLKYVPDAVEFLEKMERPPTQYIRVNTLKTSKAELEARLCSKGFQLKNTVLPEVFSVKRSDISTGATTEYLLGYYYIQDLSSCFAVAALDAHEDRSVLDVAAAPGGKTTFIAQKMKNTGLVVALEPSAKRARSLAFNLARCGVLNTCIFNTDGERAETDLKMKFDYVLLDAPCSCEGTIAKDTTRKTSHTPQDIDYCSSKQVKLIEAAINMVNPGGIMVYSTCSFAPEENEIVVDWLLQQYPNVEVDPLPYGSCGLTCFGNFKFDDQLANTRRFYPHIHDTTGFFIAKLRMKF